MAYLNTLRVMVADSNHLVQNDRLDRASLGAVNPYNPGLSGAWMLQRAMSVRPGRQPQPDFINTLLAGNFRTMERLGEPVLKPFLQVWKP